MIDDLSFTSLYLEVMRDDIVLGNATGFTTTHKGQTYLITNWHVLTGKNPENPSIIEKPEPTHLKVYYHTGIKKTEWLSRLEPLYFDGKPRWKEHPKGLPIDVVALPILIEGIFVHRLLLDLANTDLSVTPSEPVSVIGFPFGISSSGRIPVWKTGHLASDLEIDYLDRPAFLIDVTTKEGMSGSPVIAKRVGFYTPQNTSRVNSGDIYRFLGVYSGRRQDTLGSRDDYNIGVVWKVSVIEEILKNI